MTIEAMWNMAWKTMDWILNVLKALLIVGGAVATAFADIALGTITFTLLLSNVGVYTITWGKYIPFMLSLASTGIQLILWQMVDKRGGIRRAWKVGIAMKIALLAVVLMKLGDDFVDITSVKVLMVNSNLPNLIGMAWFNGLTNMALLITEVIAGFSEIFVVNAVRLMQAITDREPNISRETQPFVAPKSSYQPKHKPRNRQFASEE